MDSLHICYVFELLLESLCFGLESFAFERRGWGVDGHGAGVEPRGHARVATPPVSRGEGGVDEKRGLKMVTRGAEGNGGKESSFARFSGHSACSPDPSGMLLGRSTFKNVSEIGVLASTSFLLSPSSDGISTISARVCLRPYLSKSPSVCTRRSFSSSVVMPRNLTSGLYLKISFAFGLWSMSVLLVGALLRISYH